MKKIVTVILITILLLTGCSDKQNLKQIASNNFSDTKQFTADITVVNDSFEYSFTFGKYTDYCEIKITAPETLKDITITAKNDDINLKYNDFSLPLTLIPSDAKSGILFVSKMLSSLSDIIKNTEIEEYNGQEMTLSGMYNGIKTEIFIDTGSKLPTYFRLYSNNDNYELKIDNIKFLNN